jgi:hypothetical protein
MGNALAHLVVTPAIFYLVLGFPWNVPAASLKRWVEGGLLTVGLIVTGFMAFSTGAGEVGFTEPRFYAPVPFLFWAALRFGMLGAAGAITIIAFLSVEAALMDRRPFSGRSPAETALALQTVSVVARGSALSGRHPRRAEKEGRGFAARERSVESRNYQLADKPRRHPRSVGLHHCHQRSMAEVCRFGWCSNGRNQGRR